MREAVEAGDHIEVAQRMGAVLPAPALCVPAGAFAAIFLAAGSPAASAVAEAIRSVLCDRGMQALVAPNRPAIKAGSDTAELCQVGSCDPARLAE